jgi:plastocyanin
MASSVAAPTDISVGRPKSKYTRVAALGFLLLAAGMVTWIAGGLLAGQSLGGEELSFLGGTVVVGLVGAAVVWRFGTAGKAVGILLALAPLVMMFWVAFSLAAPGAFAEFSGAVMFLVGGLSALGFSIAGIVRRREIVMEATRGETRAMRIMVGLVAVAMLASAVVTVTGRTTVDAATAAGAAQVGMKNFAFTTSTYEATAGEPTKFVVHNGDAFVHDFAIDALGVNSGIINPGSEKLVEVTAPAGEYLIRCTLHSGADGTPADAGKDGSMSALLTVK